MDFRNLCHNINMNALREKIPARPTLPALPQIKLSKCMEKFKFFKYFHTSRDNIQRTDTLQSQKIKETFNSLERSEYVQHTPTRISTISSLMYQAEGNYNLNEANEGIIYYQCAGSIDDYPTPLVQRPESHGKHLNAIINDSEAPPSVLESPHNTQISFNERLQRIYKGLSEFKLGKLFDKQTTVRKDDIGVDYYVKTFEEDRDREQLEQEEHNMKIADNYNFKFKTPRKLGGDDSFEESSNEEATSSKNSPPKRLIRSVSKHSGDESGMKHTPPQRKLSIAPTKFSKLCTIPLNMSQDELNTDHNAQQLNKNKGNFVSNESSVFKIKNKKAKCSKLSPNKKDDINELESGEEENNNRDSSSTSKPLGVIKHNLKLLQKSIKLPIAHDTNSAKTSEPVANNVDKDTENQSNLSKAQQIRELLKRMRSQDNAQAYSSENEENVSKLNKTDLTVKLRKLKETFQKTRSESSNAGGVDSPKRTQDSLMTKLRNIRISKQLSDDPDDDEQHRTTCKESLVERAKLQLEKGVVLASQVPHRTMKKINESKLYFQPSQTETKTKKTPEKDEEDDKTNKSHMRYSDEKEDYNSKHEYLKAISENIEQLAAHSNSVAWTVKPILNDSIDTIKDDYGVNYTPRILIHQDNSDAFDSTLMITVTRSRTQSPSSIITELSPESNDLCLKRKLQQPQQQQHKQQENLISQCRCIPNKKDISNFLNESTPSREFNIDDVRRKIKCQSLDSSSLETQRNFRHNSAVELSLSTTEQGNDARKMNTSMQKTKLQRTKSVDIFEVTYKRDCVTMAYDDLDAKLRNTPTCKIKRNYGEEIRYVDDFERGSSEELDASDNDNSSRVTKILAPLKQIEINRSISPIIVEENLKVTKLTDLYMEKQKDKSLSINETMIVDSRMEDSKITSPHETPKKTLTLSEKLTKLSSPSPPPLPKSKPPPLYKTQSIIMKPEELQIEKSSPEKTFNTIRVRKPLVKTSSMRLTYTEQVNPNDAGKVNKLISRFEEPNTNVNSRPLIIARHSFSPHSDYSDDEEFIDNKPTIDLETEYERDVTPTNEDIYRNIKELNRSSSAQPTIKFEMMSSVSNTSMSCNMLDINSNFSGSEYGSPDTYPSSLLGSTEATSLSERKQEQQQQPQQNLLLNMRHHNHNNNRRSMSCDDNRFFSFDSDEENTYYSISSTNRGHYVVEL